MSRISAAIAILLLAVAVAPARAGWKADTVPGLEEVWVTDALEYGGSVWLATGNQGILEWRDGTVIRSMEELGGRRKLKLVGFDGAVKAEFPEYEHRTVEAYAAEGDHYYFLDLEEGILYRANTWW